MSAIRSQAHLKMTADNVGSTNGIHALAQLLGAEPRFMTWFAWKGILGFLCQSTKFRGKWGTFLIHTISSLSVLLFAQLPPVTFLVFARLLSP